MNKILGTFYKGNSKRYGSLNFNTIKEDYDTNNNYNYHNNINLSKSQSIYDHNYNNNYQHPKYNHISPNLIRIQYFNNYLEQFEYRRNLHMKDYISNGIYNVYQGSSDPLLERRKDVQNKLDKVKNKLLNEEAARMERLMKKVDKENHLLDDIILNQEYDVEYNKNKDEVALHLMENFDDKDFEKIYDEKKKNEEIKSFQSKSKQSSMLILSRTHSSASSNMDLLNSSEDENDELLNKGNRNSVMMDSPEKKQNNKGKRNSILNRRRGSVVDNIKNMIKKREEEKEKEKEKDNDSYKKKLMKNYEHTDIIKILSHLDKYSMPIDNVNKELIEQSKTAPKAFQELYDDIENLKSNFEEKLEKYNEENKKNISILNEVLYELKVRKNYMELEADIYRPQINKIIEDSIDKYTKRRIENEFKNNLINEKGIMENDFNTRIKLTERGRQANKLANNLINEVENIDNIYIKPTKFDDIISKNLSKQETNNNISSEQQKESNIQSNNSKTTENNENDIFPALQGLNNDISGSKKESNINISSENNKSKKSKIKKKKIKRKVEVKDLGSIGEDDDEFLYKDKNKGKYRKKETIIEI